MTHLASQSDLPTGTIVEGLRIEEVIGQGGMGTVYRATERSSGHLLAVKIINHEKADDRKAAKRFEQEARLLGRLRHSNIVDVHAIGRLPDGRYYFTMEYLDGLSLRQHLKWYGAMSLDETVRILAQVAAALDAAHAQGTIHRDVKPGNIFLNKGSSPGEMSQVKLLDFGIAKLLVAEGIGLDTTTDTVTGSPFYMSPEQCRGKDVDHRSDIYSLGLVAFEMLTGRRAFEATTLGELVLQQQTKAVQLPSQGSVQWPKAIETALQRALHKDPAQRYHRASQLVERLASTMDGEVWEGVPLDADRHEPNDRTGLEVRGSFSKTRTIVKKRSRAQWHIPALAAAIGLLGVAGILYVVLGTGGSDRPDPRPNPTIIVNPVTTSPQPDSSPQPDASPPALDLASPGAAVDSSPARKRQKRTRRTKRRKRRKRRARPKQKTKRTKKRDVVPGKPFRF